MANYLVYLVSLFMLFCVTCQYILVFQPLGFMNYMMGKLYVGFYFVLFYLLSYSYYRAIITPPGFAPLEYMPEGKSHKDLEEVVQMVRVNTEKNNGFPYKPPSNLRFCVTCNIFKPPRTHHCRQCKRCILKQDHHCPWISNCVGYHNQKPFILFLFYVTVLGTMSIVMLVFSAFYILNYNLNHVSQWVNQYQSKNITQSTTTSSQILIMSEDITKQTSLEPLYFSVDGAIVTVLFVLNFSFIIPVVLGVSGLFYFQAGFIFNNLTTIERLERKTEIKSAKRTGQKDQYRWRYDRGPTANFKEVFGERFSEWIWPVGHPKGDGLSWKTYPPLSIHTHSHNQNQNNPYISGNVEEL